MNSISQAFDSRAMPLLSEPSTAPSAFSLWQWLGERAKGSALQEAGALRSDVLQRPAIDPRLASELRATADLHALRHDR